MDGVAERIFELADNKFRDQREFGDALGVVQSVISAWRTGKSKSYQRRLPEIAAVLNTTTGYLLGEETSKKPAAEDGDGVSENEAIFRALPPDLQEEALRYMRYLAAQAGTHEDPKD